MLPAHRPDEGAAGRIVRPTITRNTIFTLNGLTLKGGTVQTVTSEGCSLVGLYRPRSFQASTKDIYFINAAGKIEKSDKAVTLNSFEAYFRLSDKVETPYEIVLDGEKL